MFFLKFFLKKILPWLLILLLLPAFPRFMRALPQSNDALISKRYEGWSGVLRLWVYEGWQPGNGSLVPWLNQCITAFEKDHSGVYIQLKQVSEQTLKDFASPEVRMPDIILFPPGLIEDASALMELDLQALDANLLPALGAVGMIQGGTRALPVAMGGYGWARNNALLSDWPQDFASAQLLNPKKSSKEAPAALALPPDGDYLSYSGALIALLGRENTAPMPIEAREEAPYTAFSNGRVAVMPMTQREMRRMALLSESGRGPNYTLDADSVRFTDQLALLALPDTGFSDSPARKELALAFAAHLMTADCQQALGSVRAFPTIPLEQALYAGVSGYEEMEQALRSEALRVPTAFVNSWRASAKSLAEQALSGQISVQSAYLQFKALFPQPVSPVQTKN